MPGELWHPVPSTRPCSRTLTGISVGFYQHCSRSSMRFVVRNVGFGLFFPGECPRLHCHCMGSTRAGHSRAHVMVMSFHRPVDVWLFCCGNAHQNNWRAEDLFSNC